MSKVLSLIKLEEKRQKETLMMIPSENIAFPNVRKALGSVLCHKYAEGQPHKRYYQGNNIVDEIESYCEDMVLKAFGLSSSEWFSNVQPHSGCEANLAVYNAVLSPNDKIMSMYLPDGGHLSHGWHTDEKKITFVSKIWNVEFYKVEKDTKVFDYKNIEKQALKFKPKLIISGGTSYPGDIDYKKMSEIAKKVGAYYLADIAHEAGLIAGRAVKSPFPWADVVTFTTHKTLRGPRGAVIIARKELENVIDSSVFPGLQGGPHIHTIAAIAAALEDVIKPEFKKYALQVVKNAKALAEEFMKLGVEVVSGGTEKHLVLLDLRTTKVEATIAAEALESVGIVLNKNTVPFETASPFYPSGLRMGTPALTVRGMKEREMKKIANLIMKVIIYTKNYRLPKDNQKRQEYLKEVKKSFMKDKYLTSIRQEVNKLCKEFPISF